MRRGKDQIDCVFILIDVELFFIKVLIILDS